MLGQAEHEELAYAGSDMGAPCRDGGAAVGVSADPAHQAMFLAESKPGTPFIGWLTLALAMADEAEPAGHADRAACPRA